MIPAKGAALLVSMPNMNQDRINEAHRRLTERGQSFASTAEHLVKAQIKREAKAAKRLRLASRGGE